jgi:hypothetical protein
MMTRLPTKPMPSATSQPVHLAEAGVRFLWGDSWWFKSLRPHHPLCILKLLKDYLNTSEKLLVSHSYNGGLRENQSGSEAINLAGKLLIAPVFPYGAK